MTTKQTTPTGDMEGVSRRFDYWMLDVIEDALKVFERKKCWTTRGRRLYKENQNRWNPLGSIRLTQRRVGEIREAFDIKIRKALDLKGGGNAI